MKFKKITNKAFSEYGVTSVKELWTKAKEEGYQGLSFSAKSTYTKSDENKFHVTFSTDSEDRHLERVYQNFDLKAFKQNPVLLDSHNYGSIEHIIGRVETAKVKDGVLQGDVVFALENPKGLLAYHLANGGFLNATSIGFIPLDFDEEGNITRSELLEISAVSVPANPEALFEKIVKEAEKGEVEPQNEETPEEEDHSPTPPEEPETPEEEPEETPEPVGERGDEKIYKEIVKMEKENQELFRQIAEGLKSFNPKEQKRKVYKAIRDAFKSR